MLFYWEIAAASQTEYVGSDACKGCHHQQYLQWQGSHHQLAMQVANKNTVLADFNNATFDYFGIKSRFYTKAGKYYINTDGPNGKMQEFEIKYVLGIEPLQQYLIELDQGKIQSLTIAWDTIKKRWFHLYPDEQIKSNDPLHWSKLYQNWNMMCGECHNTHYQKNYDRNKKSYATTWSEINVACEACHGPAKKHLDWANTNKSGKANKILQAGFDFSFKTASANQQTEVCAACHSRRTRLSAEFLPGQPLLENFLPSHLRQDLYYPDGQILDEVYVYGSFVQSRMYQAGVRCSDCHNSHQAKLKLRGNELCTQCHNEKGNKRFKNLKKKHYDTKSHHFHPSNSKGSHCVECHAPQRNYMQVDARRDHSFRIPRPDLSVKYATPNACTHCHSDKKASWAAAAVEKWYGKKRNTDKHFTEVFYRARKGDAAAEKQLITIANDRSNPAIIRATALQLIRGSAAGSGDAIMRAMKDDKALVRAYAADRLIDLPIAQRIDLAFDLLEDSVRSVRIQAARATSKLPMEQLDAEQKNYINNGLQEYNDAQQILADTPGAQLNLGVVYADQKKFELAERSYLEALRLDPTFLPAIFNLANFYNMLGEDESAIKILREGIRIAPQQGELYYSLGLVLVEDQRLQEAEKALKRAVELITDRSRMFYNYGLILQTLDKRTEAAVALHQANRLDSKDPDILYALVIYYAQQQAWRQALPFARQLVVRLPEKPEAKKLLADIEVRVR